MARDNRLRQTESEGPATAGRFAYLQSVSPVHIAAILAILAAAFLAVYHYAGIGGARKAPPQARFLTTALGAPQRSAPLVRKPAEGINIEARDRGAVSWKQYANGVTTRTWDLGVGTLTPRFGDGDSAASLGVHHGSLFHLLPAAILTLEGASITPAGAIWKLKRGSGSKLQLELGDSGFPVPHLFDPAIVASTSTRETDGARKALDLSRPIRAGPGGARAINERIAASSQPNSYPSGD